MAFLWLIHGGDPNHFRPSWDDPPSNPIVYHGNLRCHPPMPRLPPRNNKALIFGLKGNQWVFIVPDCKAGYFLGSPTWHWGVPMTHHGEAWTPRSITLRSAGQLRPVVSWNELWIPCENWYTIIQCIIYIYVYIYIYLLYRGSLYYQPKHLHCLILPKWVILWFLTYLPRSMCIQITFYIIYIYM